MKINIGAYSVHVDNPEEWMKKWLVVYVVESNSYIYTFYIKKEHGKYRGIYYSLMKFEQSIKTKQYHRMFLTKTDANIGPWNIQI